MGPKPLIVLTLLAVLLVSTIACGGGGGEQATPTLTVTPAPSPTPTPSNTPTPAPTPTPTPTLTPEGDYQSYSGDSFSISYIPTGWDIMHQLLLDSLVSEFELEAADSWGVIDTDVEEISPCASLMLIAWQEQEIEISLDSWASVIMLGFDVTDKTEVTVSGQPAYRYEQFLELSKLELRFYAFVHGTTGWLIMSMSDCYNEYESIFETMINSFHLLD